MLLIHYRQAQVAEGDAVLEQRVSADGDVDATIGQAGQHAPSFGRLHAAAEQRHPGRGAEARQGAQMLPGQQFGRHHQRGLGAGLDRA